MARRRRNPPSIRSPQRSSTSGSGDPSATIVNARPPLPAAATTVPLSSSAGRSPQDPPRPGNSVFALGSAMARRTATSLQSRRPPSIPRERLLGRNRVEYPRPINVRYQQSSPAAANRSPISSPRRGHRRSIARRQGLPPAGANRSPQESTRTPQAALRDLVVGRRTTYLREQPPSAAADDPPFSSFILWIDLNQRGMLHWLVCACASETPSIPDCDDPRVIALINQIINLEGDLGRVLEQLEFYKTLGEVAKHKVISELIKRSGNPTNYGSEDVGPSSGDSNVNQAVEEQQPLTSDQTSNEVSADQDSSPTSTPSGSGESSAAAGTGQASSAPRFRYGEPSPLDAQDDRVTATGRQVHLEPPRELSPLFVEYRDRHASLELHTDNYGKPFTVQRIRMEQIWMEIHETLPPDFGEPPNYVNVPPDPEPSATAGTHPAFSPNIYRYGEPFPHNLRYEVATITAHRVHRVAAPSAGQPEPLILFVEARGTEPFSDTFPVPGRSNYITAHQVRVQRLLLEFPREVNLNQTDRLIRQAIAVRGRNMRPSN